MADKQNDNSANHTDRKAGKTDDSPNRKKLIITTAILLLISLVFLSKTSFFTLEPSINATGTIISPLNETTLDPEFTLEVETKGVNTGQYVWIAFDNPEFRTCFPRIQVPGNEKFKVTLIEKQLKDDLRLSLYVLNETEHEKWIEWQAAQNSKGVKMPSGRKHIDHANIILK